MKEKPRCHAHTHPNFGVAQSVDDRIDILTSVAIRYLFTGALGGLTGGKIDARRDVGSDNWPSLVARIRDSIVI